MRSIARNQEVQNKSLFVICQFSLFVMVAVVLTFICWKGVFEPLLRQPTAYFSQCDQNNCERAEDAQGRSIPCAEATKGNYHTVWVAPKTLH